MGNRIPIKTGREIESMREAGGIARDILLELVAMTKPGVSTYAVDQAAKELIADRGCESAFYMYRNFPGQICISINEEVVHGIGRRDRVIQNGDIVKIDVGIRTRDGWIGDNATTVPVGPIRPEVHQLLAATEESLHLAIDHARDGEMLGDLCHSVEDYVSKIGFTVVRDFVGHGVGRELHEEPKVPNYGRKGTKPRLLAGMILAIEPMVNLGSGRVQILDDDWTVVTKDGQPSAHFEHTVLITKGEPEILTLRDRLYAPAGASN